MKAIALAVTCGTLAAGPAWAADPKVPPARLAEGSRPVAILTIGFDYTRPEIAARLARDGEGEIISWDVPGDDRFPYDPTGDTELITALAGLLPEAAPVSLLAVKIDPADPASLAKGLAFIARTPARTVLVPMWTKQRQPWDVFAQAAAHFKDLRIIVRACPDLPPSSAENIFPRDLRLPNVVTGPAASGDPAAPLQTYVAALPCRLP